MPKKAKRTKRQTGKGLGDIARKVARYIKDNKLISRGLHMIPHPAAGAAAAAARQLGYGQQTGTGLWGTIGGVADGIFGSGRMKPGLIQPRVIKL